MGCANLILKIGFLFFLGFYFTGCANNAKPASNTAHSCTTLQGHYLNAVDITYTIDIAANCTLTDNYCGYDASYTVPDSNWNTILTVNNTNGAAGCMSSTPHVCTAELTTNQNLLVSCDAGAVQFIYWRQ